jgi:hypothetical protein
MDAVSKYLPAEYWGKNGSLKSKPRTDSSSGKFKIKNTSFTRSSTPDSDSLSKRQRGEGQIAIQHKRLTQIKQDMMEFGYHDFVGGVKCFGRDGPKSGK